MVKTQFKIEVKKNNKEIKMREFEKGEEEKKYWKKKKKGKTECACAVEQFEKYEEIKTFFFLDDRC